MANTHDCFLNETPMIVYLCWRYSILFAIRTCCSKLKLYMPMTIIMFRLGLPYLMTQLTKASLEEECYCKSKTSKPI
jgi:hypothetical protein